MADSVSSIAFKPLIPGPGEGSVRGTPPFEHYGTLKRPAKAEYTPLFEGIPELETTGPKLCMKMADGRGYLQPMDPEAQKLLFRAVANVARSMMKPDDCQKIAGFVPGRDGITFVLKSKGGVLEEKFIRFERDISEADPGLDPGTDLLRDFIDQSKTDHEEPAEPADQEEATRRTSRSNLFQWIKQRLYPEAGKKRLDVTEVLDLRPRKEKRDQERDELEAASGVKRLMYLLMLAHEGIGDGYSARLRDLPPSQIEGEMDRIFGDKRSGEAQRK